MVTLGKPIGNGFPMGGIMLTRQLAEGFDNGMQYFATCGGCTAACAAGVPPSCHKAVTYCCKCCFTHPHPFAPILLPHGSLMRVVPAWGFASESG